MTKLNCSLVKTIPIDHKNKEKQIRTIIEELRNSQKMESFRKRKTLKNKRENKIEKKRKKKKSVRGKRKRSKSN